MSLALIMLLAIPANAANLSYWYSNDTTDPNGTQSVAYQPYDGSYYVDDGGGDSTFSTMLNAAVANADIEWSNTLKLPIYSSSIYSAMNTIHAADYGPLLNSFPSLKTSDAGLTYYPTMGTSTVVYYNGIGKRIYPMNSGTKMCIVKRWGASAVSYKNVALHEMGHLFGWIGHSTNFSHVMYKTINNMTWLTSQDKNHLSQVYDMMY